MMTILHSQNNPPAFIDVTLNFVMVYIATPSERATSTSMLNSGKFVLHNH